MLSVPRSGVYYQSQRNPKNQAYESSMRDHVWETFSKTPVYGYRRVCAKLRRDGYEASPKRVRSVMRDMGLRAIYPRRKLSAGNRMHKKYPYLLSDVKIERADQVWSTDITYLRLRKGFCYLTAVMDWYSRRVLSWELSTTLETDFRLSALNRALADGTPEIFNTDQGLQYTSEAFTDRLKSAGAAISMDGKGRAFDNIFIERLWRTVKYEEVFLKEYRNPVEARAELEKFFEWYNGERPHQSLGYRTPNEVYFKPILSPTG